MVEQDTKAVGAVVEPAVGQGIPPPDTILASQRWNELYRYHMRLRAEFDQIFTPTGLGKMFPGIKAKTK